MSEEILQVGHRGRADALAQEIVERTGAKLVVLLIIDASGRPGLSQSFTDPTVLKGLPGALESMAAYMRQNGPSPDGANFRR